MLDNREYKIQFKCELAPIPEEEGAEDRHAHIEEWQAEVDNDSTELADPLLFRLEQEGRNNWGIFMYRQESPDVPSSLSSPVIA